MTISTRGCLPFKFPTFTLTKKQTSNNQFYYDNCNNISKEFNLIKPSELTKDDKIKLLEALMGKFDNHIYENGQTGKEIVTSITSNLVEILAHMTTQKLEYIDEDIDSNILTLLNDTKKGCEVLGLQFIEISGLIKLRPQIFGLPLFYSEVPKRLEELIHKVGERQMLIISNEAQKWLRGNGDYGDITFVTRRLVEIINTAMDRKKGEPQTIQYPRLVKPLPGGYKITATISILGRCEIQHPFITPVEYETQSLIVTPIKRKETTIKIEDVEDDEIKITYEKLSYDEEKLDNNDRRSSLAKIPNEHQDNEPQHNVANNLKTLLIGVQTNPGCKIARGKLTTWWNQSTELDGRLLVEFDSPLTTNQINDSHQLLENLIKLIEKNMDRRLAWVSNEIRAILDQIAGLIIALIYHSTQNHKQKIDEESHVIQLRNKTHELLEQSYILHKL